MQDDGIILRIEELSQHFQVGNRTLRAVDGVSLELSRGEIFGLVGESGCGKTTLGRTVMKIYRCTSGSVYFHGKRICAGTLGYRKDIAQARAQRDSELAKIRGDGKLSPSQKRDAADAVRHTCKMRVSQLQDEISRAKRDSRGGAEVKIQMIFQDPIASLNPRMTVGEIISEGLIVSGERDKTKIRDEVAKMLSLVGLSPEHAGRYPHEFSGGQRQRIGIARALIMRPEIIIADEPVSALDVSVQAQIINLLHELRDSLGLTILFIAHDLSVVKYFSDRVGVMYAGRIIEIANSDELFSRPCHPYTRALLSAIPLPDPYYESSRKRIIYEPQPYSEGDGREMRELFPDHRVYCTQEEAQDIIQSVNAAQSHI